MAAVPSARPPEQKLRKPGPEQWCNEMPQPSSLFLPGAYKAQMCSHIWTNTKPLILKRKGLSYPPPPRPASPFRQKAAGDEVWSTGELGLTSGNLPHTAIKCKN